MLSFRKPSADSIQKFLAKQKNLDLTYPEVGATANQRPPGYTIDHTRIQLGKGQSAFQKAKSALQRWEHFNLSWLEISCPDIPIRPGETIAVVARVMGLWWLNACRIVYVIDENGRTTQFGFAYGTLPQHAATGEERFLVEWNQADDSVWYDILAFSRPRHFFVKLGSPLVRLTQKKFSRNSATAMQRAVLERKNVDQTD